MPEPELQLAEEEKEFQLTPLGRAWVGYIIERDAWAEELWNNPKEQDVFFVLRDHTNTSLVQGTLHPNEEGEGFSVRWTDVNAETAMVTGHEASIRTREMMTLLWPDKESAEVDYYVCITKIAYETRQDLELMEDAISAMREELLAKLPSRFTDEVPSNS